MWKLSRALPKKQHLEPPFSRIERSVGHAQRRQVDKVWIDRIGDVTDVVTSCLLISLLYYVMIHSSFCT